MLIFNLKQHFLAHTEMQSASIDKLGGVLCNKHVLSFPDVAWSDSVSSQSGETF